MKKLYILLLGLFMSLYSFSQDFGIGPNALIFQGGITTSERDALNVPNGEYWLIYNVQQFKFQYWNGTVWVDMIGSTTNNNEATAFSDRSFPTNLSNPISIEYPSLTTTEVRNLTGSNTATTDDSAAWFYLQEALYASQTNFYNIENVKKIKIPSGYSYPLSQPLILDIGGSEIDFTGARLIPASGYTDYLVHIVSQWGLGKYKNLYLDGNYQSNGLWIDYEYTDMNDTFQSINHWSFQNLFITKCKIGMKMSDTYYGSIFGHSLIGNCLIGMQLYDGYPNGWYGNGPSSEVNTLNIMGIDFNGPNANDLTNFGVPSNYESIALLVGVTALNVNFRSLTIENWHTGFKFDDKIFENHTPNGTNFPPKQPKIHINYCYFENIGNRVLNVDYTNAGSYIEGSFDKNHVNINSINDVPIRIPYGAWNIEMNNFTRRSREILEIGDVVGWKTTIVKTDLQPFQIKNAAANPERVIIKHTKALEGDPRDRWRPENYVPIGGNTGNNPPEIGVLPNWSLDQEKEVLRYPQNISGVPTQFMEFQTATNNSIRDISFTDASKGFILKDRANGKFYRAYIENGEFKLEEENRLGQVYRYNKGLNINFFLNTTNPSGESEKWYGLDFPYSLMKYNGNNWVQTVSGTDMICIGNSNQRPTNRPTGFVYYDTTLNNFYTWNGSAWVLTNNPSNDIILNN